VAISTIIILANGLFQERLTSKAYSRKLTI
jgi:hypothetical protein